MMTIPRQPTHNLCDVLREILPRLPHLRLRLSTLYPAIRGDGLNPNQSSKSVVKFQADGSTTTENANRELYPTSHLWEPGPYLRDLSKKRKPLHFLRDQSFRSPDCHGRCFMPFPNRPRSFLLAADCLRVLHALPHSNDDQTVYASLIQRNILEDMTQSLPFLKHSRLSTDQFPDPYAREPRTFPPPLKPLEHQRKAHIRTSSATEAESLPLLLEKRLLSTSLKLYQY